MFSSWTLDNSTWIPQVSPRCTSAAEFTSGSRCLHNLIIKLPEDKLKAAERDVASCTRAQTVDTTDTSPPAPWMLKRRQRNTCRRVLLTPFRIQLARSVVNQVLVGRPQFYWLWRFQKGVVFWNRPIPFWVELQLLLFIYFSSKVAKCSIWIYWTSWVT